MNLESIGYRRSNGEDFFLTASKTFPKLGFGRPLIISVGGRLSEAADIGFLGFGDTYRATFEGNVVWLPFDKFVVGYEFRQKTHPYQQFGTLIGPENNWQAFDAA